jgi:hypothetical protein
MLRSWQQLCATYTVDNEMNCISAAADWSVIQLAVTPSK